MKARKLDVTNYSAKAEGAQDEQDVGVVESICGLLCHPALKLGGRELVKASQLCDRIEGADGTILLDEEDYKRVRVAAETVPGLPRVFVKLIERIFDAEEVDVEEIS